MQQKYHRVFITSVLILVSITMVLTFTGLPSSASSDSANEADQKASDAYYIILGLTGETQGEIKGDSIRSSGKIDVIGFEHAVISPRDAASGLPTGKRQHKPLTVTKHIDKATPLLANVLVNNENIVNFRLDFYRPAPDGSSQQYYTIELVNAQISSVRYATGPNSQPVEYVSFVYQKIIWTWQDGGITAEDDWSTPVV